MNMNIVLGFCSMVIAFALVVASQNDPGKPPFAATQTQGACK